MSLVSVLLCSFPTSISIHFIHFPPKLSILDTVFVSDLDNQNIDYQIINLFCMEFCCIFATQKPNNNSNKSCARHD